MSLIIHRSGKVERWHTNPEVPAQTTADHTWGMVALYFALCPEPDLDTIQLITFHDSHELFGGDLAYPFKLANPDLAEDHEEVCQTLAVQAGVPVPATGDQKWCDFLDRLECYLHVKLKAPYLLQNHDWRDMQDKLFGWATELNCQDKLMEMING